MKGDFTRETFDPANAFTRVLMQQGRVQLDADWNEQAAIFTYALRSFTKDLLGPWAGPTDELGFKIELVDGGNNDLTIGTGVYYVDGIRLFNAEEARYSTQVNAVETTEATRERQEALFEPNHNYLVYLDVWERHVSAVEHPSIREAALLGPAPAPGARLVWRVRSAELKIPPTRRRGRR